MKAKEKVPLERDIQKAILEWLAWKKIPAWRVNVGMIPAANGAFRANSAMKGMSDIIGIVPDVLRGNGSLGIYHSGVFLAIEVKRPGEKPTAAQEAFLGQVRAAGGIAIVARSVADVEAVLGAL
jgi:hypothetical protein